MNGLIHICFLSRKKPQTWRYCRWCVHQGWRMMVPKLSFSSSPFRLTHFLFHLTNPPSSKAELYSLTQPVHSTAHSFCSSVLLASIRKSFAHSCSIIDAKRRGLPYYNKPFSSKRLDFVIFSMGFPRE